jgi:hypothetical protein
VRRNARRKEEFLKKDSSPAPAAAAASAKPPVPNTQQIQCEQCDYKADTSQLLMTHVNSRHQVFKCDYCEYKSQSKDTLKEHMQKHTKNNHRARSPPRRHPRNSSPPCTFRR